MTVSYVNTIKTTAFSTFDVLDSNTSHQFVFQTFESSALGTSLNPSSGRVILKYRPLGSTAYITHSTNINLTASPQIVSLTSRIINSVQVSHTHPSSASLKVDYIGWKV